MTFPPELLLIVLFFQLCFAAMYAGVERKRARGRIVLGIALLGLPWLVCDLVWCVVRPIWSNW